MKIFTFLLTCILLLNFQTFAQVFTNKEVGKKNEDFIDSLKKSEYPYTLPIWGAKATKAGYNLPYSAGVSAQYFWQESDLVIDNLNVGFNNGPMHNLDEIVRFNTARATASAATLRPDIWLFPFLNIYGIFGRAKASTEVGFGVWVPDSTNTPKEVMSASTIIEFNTSTYGIGFTPTIGIGGGFLALDMNVAWTDVPQLSKPAQSFIFGPRLGKNFKLKKPESGIAIWVGAFRVQISSETNGSINLSEVLPPGEFGAKVDQGIARVGNAQQQVDAWWASLTPPQQQNPVNEAKYNTANRALARAGEILASANNALGTLATSTVQYSMDKRPKDPWNFIVGSQYQLSKHFMLRGEYGFLGSRTQLLLACNTGLACNIMQRMKKYFLICGLMLFGFASNAQVLISILLGDKLNTGKIEFGLVGGASWSTIKNLDGAKSLPGFNLGFYFDFKLKNPSWMVNTGVIVKSPMGADDLPLYSLNDSHLDSAFAGGHVTRKLRYFNVPVMMKYKFRNNLFVKGGIQLGLLNKTFDEFKNSVKEEDDLEHKLKIKGEFHPLDAGLAFGVGYHLLKGNGMNLNLQYYHGLIDIVIDDSTPNQFNRVFYLTVGIPIGKNPKTNKNSQIEQ